MFITMHQLATWKSGEEWDVYHFPRQDGWGGTLAHARPSSRTKARDIQARQLASIIELIIY